jgi:hypothetical protein
VAEQTDPYTIVLGGLYTFLLRQTELARRVKVRNIITFTGPDRDPIKPEVSAADLPEIRIVSIGSRPMEHSSSCMSTDTALFEIQVASGDQRLDHQHFPLKWEIFRALRHGLESTMKALQWNERSFVLSASLVRVTEGVLDSDLNRGIKGWSGLYGVEVEMQFRTIDL